MCIRDKIRPFLPEYPAKIHVADDHADNQHAGRADHISETADAAANYHREFYLRSKQESSYQHCDYIRIQYDLLIISLCLLAYQSPAMGPPVSYTHLIPT